MAKNAEKKRQPSNNRQNNNIPPNPHMNGGRKPLPPAAPKEEPKKLSILDRIVKPGDKGKVITKPSENAIFLKNTKQEKIIKKVKLNPETK